MQGQTPSVDDRWRIFAGSVEDLAIILLDTENRITDWNIGAQALLGYTSDQACGRSGAILFVAEDRESGIPERELEQVLLTGRAEEERWHLRSDGSRFRASETLTALRDSESTLIGFARVMRDITRSDQEKQQTERTLRDRTALVREIQHRVKNNLQMIVSLISLQAHRITEQETLGALQETQNRVRAIAAIHETLYAAPDFGTISVGPYLRQLVRDLCGVYDPEHRVEIAFDAADLALDIREAMPLALIANELLSNALKHGFTSDRRGFMAVGLGYTVSEGEAAAPERVELVVRDDGVGLPEGVEFQAEDSTGFELIRLLTQQLRGSVDITSGSEGTCARVSFPLEYQ